MPKAFFYFTQIMHCINNGITISGGGWVSTYQVLKAGSPKLRATYWIGIFDSDAIDSLSNTDISWMFRQERSGHNSFGMKQNFISYCDSYCQSLTRHYTQW